jgi:LPS sulfotransferase NodH
MKKKDSLLVRAAWKIRNVLPDPVECYCIRIYRRVLQFKGYPFSRRRPGVVVMLHIGRCGSTVLANMLDQNPNIFWDGKTARRAHEIYGDSVKTLDISTWFKRQFSISGSRYYGFEFKMLRDQYVRIFDITVPEFLGICKSIGVTHFILLYRGNTLNQAISHYSGLSNKVWHISPDSGKRASRKSFSIDFEHVTTGSGEGLPLPEYLRDIENTKDEIREILQDQNILELEYESDILEGGPMTAYQKICGFLKVPAGEVFVKNKKVLVLPPSEAVENYGDAVRALSGTEFEWMLDQV